MYWMSRYLERAEHIARVLGVQLNLMLEQDPKSSDRRWLRVLVTFSPKPQVRLIRALKLSCAKPCP